MDSIWRQNAEYKRFEQLQKNINTDVLIIGGGIAGILCAFKLKEKGVDCILVEASQICGGITKNTTAKITFCHGLIYDKLIRFFGEKKAQMYLTAQLNATDEYDRLCRDIDCDYEKKDSYVYSVNNYKKIEDEVKALNRLGINAKITDGTNLPFSVAGAVHVEGQAQFHPLKFLYEISKNLPIYENTKILGISPHKAITNKAEINFNKVIIATHFPILNKFGLYPLKLYQHRSYVLALKGAPGVNGMYKDESDKGISLRNFGDVLLIGGGAHRTGKKGGCWQELQEFTSKYYKNAKVVGKWATQDCMTVDGVPYIGNYSNNTPHVYVATGFNKWGITNAMVASEILSDLVCGKQNPFADVFSPSRSILHLQLFVNICESVMGLLTPTIPRCPHLGCALKYNRAEHTWDCPCHGSRFTEQGELIDNPATDDKRK